jgi:hypothetical protein
MPSRIVFPRRGKAGSEDWTAILHRFETPPVNSRAISRFGGYDEVQ